jgi:glycosyltransferase involved in cell wall biosynthesis
MNHQSSPTSDAPLRVLIVAAHDSLGGAARAIRRVFDSLSEYETNLNVTLRVIHKTVEHPRILGGKPARSRLEYAEYWLRTRFRKYFPRAEFVTSNPVLHSQALYPTGLGREINAFNPDVVLFGWLGNATISIEEIGRIKAPIVWRLSDLWVLAGAEHLTPTKRYADNYSRQSRPQDESGPDINRETFRRKKRAWGRKNHRIIALSSWQADQARLSTLTRRWPISVVPVPVDPDVWVPVNKAESREQLGLPQDSLLIAFGAGQATKHAHKGADLLFNALPRALQILRDKGVTEAVELVVFGEEENPTQSGDIPIHFLGKLDDSKLRFVYSAVDVLAAPSRQESFGQVAAEAQCCGLPVIVFDNSGLRDVVDDRKTGRIVPAFDTELFAESIAWILSDPAKRSELGHNARERAMYLWHPKTVAKQYADVLYAAASGR